MQFQRSQSEADLFATILRTRAEWQKNCSRDNDDKTELILTAADLSSSEKEDVMNRFVAFRIRVEEDRERRDLGLVRQFAGLRTRTEMERDGSWSNDSDSDSDSDCNSDSTDDCDDYWFEGLEKADRVTGEATAAVVVAEEKQTFGTPTASESSRTQFGQRTWSNATADNEESCRWGFRAWRTSTDEGARDLGHEIVAHESTPAVCGSEMLGNSQAPSELLQKSEESSTGKKKRLFHRIWKRC